jgi:hypothetical protein
MRKRNRKKMVYEGQFVAEVDVNLVETDEGWSPYLSLEDAYKLDDVRDALRRGDLEAAMRFARVFKLMPIIKTTGSEEKSFQKYPD